MFVLCLTIMNLNVHLEKQVPVQKRSMSIHIWEGSVEQLFSLSECSYYYLFVSLTL